MKNGAEAETRSDNAVDSNENNQQNLKRSAKSYTAQQFADALRASCERSQSAWTHRALKEAMLQHEVDVNPSMVRAVMKKLKEEVGVDNKSKMDALQALVEMLNQEGHYCRLITERGASVRKQAISLAEARYHGIMRRKCPGKQFKPFNPETVETKKYPDKLMYTAAHAP
eukprot:2209866-Pleurochrysis_carterae.AAC.2